MSWAQFKNLIVRNWREKLTALLLAFLFWFMIKGHANRGVPRNQPPLPPLRVD